MSARETPEMTQPEAELLLPWYVNGTASDEERALVEDWLAQAPEAAGHLGRVQEESDLTRESSEALGVPGRHVLDDLMARVAPTEAGAGGRAGVIDTIWSWLSPRYALAGAAALAVVVVGQGAALTSLMGQGTPATYTTASSSAVATRQVKREALVAFAPEATLTDIAALLEELGLTITDGPKPGGMFVVSASDTEEGRAALSALSGRDEVLFHQLREN